MKKVPDLIRDSQKTLFSFELLPPLKGNNIDSIYQTIDALLEFNPAFINITAHREEVIYKKMKDGLLKSKTVRKRPGTVAIAAAIKYKYNVLVVPHILCGGFSRSETEYALIDLNFLDIHNLLILRGDVQKHDRYFKPEKDGHSNANELIKQVNDLNNGIYLDEDLENSKPMCFSFGVAGYPEKHAEAPNMESDLLYLKQKVEAGAEYIVTQMFFDNKHYYNFVDRCRKIGINVPIIPGLTPFSVKRQLNILPQVFNIDIPEEFAAEVRKCKSNDEVYQLGIEWGIHQAQDLIKNNVPVIHFFSMGKADNVKKIAKAVF